MRPDRTRALNREVERLKRQPVFGCLDEQALRHLAFSAETRQLAAGHVVFAQGAPADAAVLVTAGTLMLGSTREPEASVRMASAGTLLNEMALFAPGINIVTATARGAATIVSVSHGLMMRVLDVYPDNAVALRRYWAERLRERLAAFRDATRR